MATVLRDDVASLLDTIGAEVAALHHAPLRALAPALAQARAELAEDLLGFLNQAGGDERYTAQMHRRALVQIQGALEQVKELEPKLFAQLNAGGLEAGSAALKHLHQEFHKFSMIYEGTVRDIPLKAGAILAHGERTLMKRYATSAHRYAGQVGDDIRRQLAIGILKGETIFQMTNRLQRHAGPRGIVALRGIAGQPGAVTEVIAEGLFKRYRGWAARLVRTEIVNAYNVQAHEALEELHEIDPGVVMMWNAAVDRVCPICRELDGEKAPVDGTFKGGVKRPPAHPNCFPAGTRVLCVEGWKSIESVAVGDLVLTHRGRWRRVLGLSRQHSAGALVALHWRGNVLRATPNHPVLTPGGWVAAEDLDVGGAFVHVLQGLVEVAHDAPAETQQDGLLGGILSGLARGVVPAASIDLDRELLGHHGQIDIEDLDGVTRHRVETTPAKCVEKSGLKGGIDAALSSPRPPGEFIPASLHAPDGGVSGLGLPASFLRRHEGVAAGVVLRGGAHDASTMEESVDRSAAAAKATSERDRGLAVQVERDDFVLRENERPHHSMMPVHCAIGREPFSGEVFNFQVEEDESYVAEGFVVHNCRCALAAWHEDWNRAKSTKPRDTQKELEKQKARQAAKAQKAAEKTKAH